MAPWDTNEGNTIPREEAFGRIQEKARDEGIDGTFKVFYDGRLIAAPDDLPAEVDMNRVRISAVHDQASR